MCLATGDLSFASSLWHGISLLYSRDNLGHQPLLPTPTPPALPWDCYRGVNRAGLVDQRLHVSLSRIDPAGGALVSPPTRARYRHHRHRPGSL